VWGLDIVGPLRKAPGGFTHLLVAIDKFSKWVEVRPITNLRTGRNNGDKRARRSWRGVAGVGEELTGVGEDDGVDVGFA
jgi:hypothetical protein